MSLSSDSLSLHEAAEHLAVHYMTIYRYVRLGLLPAHKEGGSWRVERSDLEAFRQPASAGTGRHEAPWSGRLEGRMLAGDVTGAWAVIEAALASGTEPAAVYAEVLAPALVSIGDRWESGEIGVEDEHLASAVAGRLIGRLGSRFARRGRPRGTVITAAPPGDRHGLGLSMLADVLRGEGYAVLDLGPDTPVASLVAAVEKPEELSAVCISVVLDDAMTAAAEMISGVKEAVDVPVLVGGRAVSSADVATGLGADGWALELVDVAALIGALNADRRSA